MCLHYDPDLVTPESVKHLATRARAAVTARYQHETQRVTSMDRVDCAASIEHILQRVPGVLVASVNYAAEKIHTAEGDWRIWEAICGWAQGLQPILFRNGSDADSRQSVTVQAAHD